MDYVKCILVFVVLFVHIEAGGHGEKHHDHVKLHLPEFIHHDRHTKVITIHHHHHKPKKEHHHHHHHHKPKAPQGHHYQHHHKKTSTHSVSKGHSSHGSHGSHGNHGHHGSHGHHGHGHGHHGHEHKHHDTPLTYDSPTVNYQPPSYESPTVNYQPPSYDSPTVNYSPSSSFEDDFGFLSSAPAVPGSPKIHGVVHTIKQTKVFNSLPNGIPGTSINSANTGSKGYEVTEEGNEGEDDVYTAVNSLSQTYPGTYGFVRNAAAENNNDPFAQISHQSSNPVPNHDAFQAAPSPSFGNIQSLSSQSDPFQSSISSQGVQSSEFPSGFEDSNSLSGHGQSGAVGFSSAEDFIEDTPLSFNREAGIQQSINTGGVESFVY